VERSIKDKKMKDNITYDSGAKRSAQYARYRDVPVCLIRRIAGAFSAGASKYERSEDGFQPFEKNWKKGDLVFALDALDHAIRHLLLYSEVILARLNGVEHTLDPELYDTDDDHLANAGANLAMLAWFEEQGMFELSSRDFAPPPEPEPSQDNNIRDVSDTIGQSTDTISHKILRGLGLK